MEVESHKFYGIGKYLGISQICHNKVLNVITQVQGDSSITELPTKTKIQFGSLQHIIHNAQYTIESYQTCKETGKCNSQLEGEKAVNRNCPQDGPKVTFSGQRI